MIVLLWTFERMFVYAKMVLIKYFDIHVKNFSLKVLEVVITMLKVDYSIFVQFATLKFKGHFCENNLIRYLERL